MNRSAIAKQKVRDAADTVLVEAGVAGFTVDAVAKRSGVAKTTIYRHWPSTHALLIDTVACQIQQLPTPNTGSLRGDLSAFFDQVVPMVESAERARMMFGLLQAAADDPDLRTALNQLIRERTGPVRTMLQLARARGEISPEIDLDHAVDVIEGPLLYRFMLRAEPFDRHDLERILDLVIAGLTAPR